MADARNLPTPPASPESTNRNGVCAWSDRTTRRRPFLPRASRNHDGVGLVQARGGEVVVVRPGDVIYTPPGEEHWHGAAPDDFMAHTAIWEDDDTTWGAHVTDEEYGIR